MTDKPRKYSCLEIFYQIFCNIGTGYFKKLVDFIGSNKKDRKKPEKELSIASEN